ncbi:MAG: CysS/YqeB C-terminal domain-containing protein, partial [Actinomycetota bacterium]
GNVVMVDELVERGIDPLSFRWLAFQTQYRSEMDFTWEAMETADQRVKQLRRHMVDWLPPAEALGDRAEGFRSRFRDAVSNDLHMPGAVALVNELDHSPEVPAGEKYALLAAWDAVLGLDLERDAAAGWAPSPSIEALVTERDAARAAKEYATSDRLRGELEALGLEVMDTAEGTKVRPAGRPR